MRATYILPTILALATPLFAIPTPMAQPDADIGVGVGVGASADLASQLNAAFVQAAQQLGTSIVAQANAHVAKRTDQSGGVGVGAGAGVGVNAGNGQLNVGLGAGAQAVVDNMLKLGVGAGLGAGVGVGKGKEKREPGAEQPNVEATVQACLQTFLAHFAAALQVTAN